MPNQDVLLEADRHDRERGCDLLDQSLEQIADALRGLRFGQITIVVHEGIVVQIDRTERKRLG